METILAYVVFFFSCAILLGQLFQVAMFATVFLGVGSVFKDLLSVPLGLVKRAPLILLPFALFYFGITAGAIKLATVCWPYL